MFINLKHVFDFWKNTYFSHNRYCRISDDKTEIYFQVTRKSLRKRADKETQITIKTVDNSPSKDLWFRAGFLIWIYLCIIYKPTNMGESEITELVKITNETASERNKWKTAKELQFKMTKQGWNPKPLIIYKCSLQIYSLLSLWLCCVKWWCQDDICSWANL